MIDYPQYLERMIVEIADRQIGDKIHSVRLTHIHDELFPDSPLSWRESLASELHRQGMGVDWQATDNLSFLPNGALFARAAEIRRASQPAKWSLSSIDWTKWGTIFAALGILVTIIIAVFQ